MVYPNLVNSAVIIDPVIKSETSNYLDINPTADEEVTFELIPYD